MITGDNYYCPECHRQPLKIDNFRAGFDTDRMEPFLGVCDFCGQMLGASDLDNQDEEEDEAM